jgi:hypothetical protein
MANNPWANGQVERMNRTIKDDTVKRFHYESHDQLRVHLTDFIATYNFARRLKTLSGRTPYEYICKAWTSGPDRFIVNPIRQPDAAIEHLILGARISGECEGVGGCWCRG